MLKVLIGSGSKVDRFQNPEYKSNPRKTSLVVETTSPGNVKNIFIEQAINVHVVTEIMTSSTHEVGKLIFIPDMSFPNYENAGILFPSYMNNPVD